MATVTNYPDPRTVRITIRRRNFETDDAWLDPEDRWDDEIQFVVVWETFYVESWGDYRKAGNFAGGLDEPARDWDHAWSIAEDFIEQARERGWAKHVDA